LFETQWIIARIRNTLGAMLWVSQRCGPVGHPGAGLITRLGGHSSALRRMTMTIGTLLIVLLVLVLLLPYAWGYETDFLGRRSGYWRSILYTYAFGPGYEHVEFDGLRRLQGWLLLLITTAATRLQPDLIAWVVEFIRQALGL